MATSENYPSGETDDAAEWARVMSAALVDDLHGLVLDPAPGATLHVWLCNAIETGKAFGAAREARTGQYASGMAAALGDDWRTA